MHGGEGEAPAASGRGGELEGVAQGSGARPHGPVSEDTRSRGLIAAQKEAGSAFSAPAAAGAGASGGPPPPGGGGGGGGGGGVPVGLGSTAGAAFRSRCRDCFHRWLADRARTRRAGTRVGVRNTQCACSGLPGPFPV